MLSLEISLSRGLDLCVLRERLFSLLYTKPLRLGAAREGSAEIG